jgi:hypothetical protein
MGTGNQSNNAYMTGIGGSSCRIQSSSPCRTALGAKEAKRRIVEQIELLRRNYIDKLAYSEANWNGDKWESWANWTRGSDRLGYSVKAASGIGMGSTGNRAFDEWRATELARLEEERQKLVAAEREFAEFMENLRHARDREEFQRFMVEH